MVLASELDAGPLLLQGQVPVMDDDTTGTLTAKLSEVSAQLLVEVLPRWARGEIIPRGQDHAQATYLGRRGKGEGYRDWPRPAAELRRRVRAFQPWPGCYTTWKGKQLKIIEAAPVSAGEEAGPGRVITLKGEKAVLGVGTGEGTLGLVTVQIEGKKAMSAADFLKGQREIVGAVLPS
jgi:methionyl-tRNA formyltransferase